MGGIGAIGNRNEEKLYCEDDKAEPEPVCRASEEGSASTTFVCSAPASAEAASNENHLPAGSNADESSRASAGHVPEADYWTLSVGVGAVIGVSASATLDRHGHVYLGVGGGMSLSPAVTASLVAGQMVDKPSPTEQDLTGLLAGDAVSASAGAIKGAGITNSAGGTAIERGIYVPQAGVAFEHNWDVSSNGPRW